MIALLFSLIIGCQDVTPVQIELHHTLTREAPETLEAPRIEQFASREFYLVALAKYEKYGQWSTEDSAPSFRTYEGGTYLKCQ